MKTKELEKYPLQILMMTLTSFLTLLIPKLLNHLKDDILMANNKEKILPWFMITFGVTSLLMIMKFYFITYNPIKIGIKNTFRLQIKAAKDILNMNQSVYADEDKGYYYNVCSNSCAAYGDLYEEIHLNLISCFIYVCGILAVVFMTNIYLGIFFIVYGIVLIIVSLNISKPLFDMQKNVMVKQDRYLNGIRNIIENKIGINALHREKFFADEYKQNIVPYEKHVLRYRFLECLCRQAPNILDQVCLVVFLFIGGNLVLNQQISIGEFLMMYQYMAYFSDPITTACAILMRYRANMVHVARIDKLSDDAKIPKETKKYMTNTENLFFTEKYDFYKGKEKTDFLFHIDKLKIKKGGLYVIKGENGSGKSTLMRLILGEMKPDEGEIILMNNDPRLKKRIGYVSQNGISKNQSFPATVEEIMITGLYQELGLFHLPHKKHKNKIKETLRDFGMEEFLKRRIGELSGGQQQRVMIARAMIGDPKLLILDEPTTGVDARSTKILYDMLYEINTKYNTTIFMITHGRLQECKGCDRILRMDEGRIVEE